MYKTMLLHDNFVELSIVLLFRKMSSFFHHFVLQMHFSAWSPCPQPHPLLHFLVRMKPTSTNVFLQVAENLEITRRKIWAVRRMLKCFPDKYPKLISHQIASIGTDFIMQKNDSVRQHSRAFWFYGVSQHPQLHKKRTTPLCSSLLASISNAGRTHFKLRSPPEK